MHFPVDRVLSRDTHGNRADSPGFRGASLVRCIDHVITCAEQGAGSGEGGSLTPLSVGFAGVRWGGGTGFLADDIAVWPDAGSFMFPIAIERAGVRPGDFHELFRRDSSSILDGI